MNYKQWKESIEKMSPEDKMLHYVEIWKSDFYIDENRFPSFEETQLFIKNYWKRQVTT
jgi:hypothetical protein